MFASLEIINKLMQYGFPAIQLMDNLCGDYATFDYCTNELLKQGYTEEMLITELQVLPMIRLFKLDSDFDLKIKACKSHNFKSVPIMWNLTEI